MAVKVAINGFGRIGRLALRASLKYPELEVVAINDITNPETLAHLLKYDSVHGRFDGEVKVENENLVVNGKTIKVTAIKDPAELPWKELGIDIVLECTGLFRTGEKSAKHLKAGAKKVIISAPAKEIDATLVIGVNHHIYDPEKHNIVSNASCTTNCLAPIAKILMDNFGIVTGIMTTIHAYTNDQRILDLPHKDLRRARAAAMSMIPTTTGAAEAVGLVIPELKGKLTGMAIRVPTPNVSVVDLVVNTEKEVTVEEVNAAVKKAAEGELKGIVDYCDEPLVSIDFNGCPASATFDSLCTKVIEGKMVKVVAYYDNEWGYSNRLVELAKFIGEKL